MQHVDVPLDQLILDMSELDTLLSRLSSSIGDVDLDVCGSDKVNLLWLEVLYRVQESSGALNDLARAKLKRHLAAKMAAAEDTSEMVASADGALARHLHTD